MSSDHRHLYPLRQIAEDFLEGVNYNALSRWSEPGRKLDFPKPKRRLGRYKLYDVREVVEWVELWKKINGNLGNGEKINGKRQS